MPSFVEVQSEQFEAITELLKSRLPNSSRTYNVLKLVTKSGLEFGGLTTKVYAYDGNITDTESAFILTIQAFKDLEGGYYILASHADTVTEEMFDAFETLIDWRTRGKYGELGPQFVNFYEKLAEKRRLIPGVVSVDLETHECKGYHFEKEQAMELNIEDECEKAGVTLKQLDETAIPALNASWRERETQLIDYCIRNLPSSGIFVDGDLASWAMTTPYGGINALHTEPNHRQKGFGVLAVKALAKYQADTLDFLPCSRVVVDNVASEKVMLKAGCHYSHNLYWFFYTEKYENETIDQIE